RAAEPEAGRRVTFERPRLELVEMASPLVDPRAVLAVQEPAPGGEQRDQGRAPGVIPRAGGHARLGAVDRFAGCFEIDPRIGRKLDAIPAVKPESSATDGAAEL